ncbi:MAG TPA: alpha-2-macroglobulin family protein [Chitinophagaceae bacterium]|nr:alpha-2-macroglobulin family protein [Chitinophagaceae bacterium]
MIRIITFVLAILTVSLTMAQTPTNYTEKWKKVKDLLNNRGLTKTAIAEIEKIYQLAKKENQEAQQVKALIYLAEYGENLDEAGEINGIKKLEDELKLSKAPVRQILHSILAGRYYNYFQENRWRLYNRTAIPSQTGGNIDTWGIEELHQKIAFHYKNSLSEKTLLQKTALSSYEPLINKGNARNLRPTLFDMLAHQALDYFRNDERDLKKPAYHFTIDDAKAFATSGIFINTDFATSDTSSLYHEALLIYQQLLAFHLNDRDPTALIDADLERLDFMYAASVLENKDKLYNDALQTIQKKYPTHPYGALAAVIRLENLHTAAMNYRPGISDPALRYALVDIRKELEQASGKFPGTEADARTKNLLTIILDQSIGAKTELVNVPGKPFLSLVNFRNLNTFYYRIIRVDDQEKIRVGTYETYWNKLVNIKPEKQVKQALPLAEDHREHSVEIKIDALPLGEYALLCSANENFSLTNNHLTIQFFHVSQISYINKGENYFILNRETGEPIQGAEVRVMEQKYDNIQSRVVYKQLTTSKSNNDGYLKLTFPNNINRYALDVNWKQDRLFTRRTDYYVVYNPDESRQKDEIFTSIFTDRSIYRPGQTVYFKGIRISRNRKENRSSVVAGQKTIVSLYDANGQKKDSLSLITNEYGSYNGQFHIPENLLTGIFSLRDDSGNAYAQFSVEEYKRPTFEIVFDPMTGSYRLNDTLPVTGTVAGYAGNTLNDAAVKYRVVRRTNFPWPWRFNIWPPDNEEMEIANGTTTTDEKGKFRIPFKAIPDLKVNSKLEPRFRYEVIVDATDNSGETRSGSKSLNIGYKAVILGIEMKEEYMQDSLKQILVSAKNFESVSQKMKITVKITELDAPSRLLKNRVWDLPDTTLMSKTEFTGYFPNDPYLNETDPTAWSRKKEVLSITDSTGTISLNNASLAPGYYLVEVLGKDKFGEEVKDMKYVKILSNTKPFPSYTWKTSERIVAEPGKTVTTSIGTSAEQVYAILQRDKNGNSDDGDYKLIRLNNSWYEITVPVTEQDRGGFSIIHSFVKHNRFFQVVQEIDVPWTNKKLDITVETYRDKLLPGSTETWKVKIRGSKGEKIASEMLTSMYDASLDQFKLHQWILPSLFTEHTVNLWISNSNFATANEESHVDGKEYAQFTQKQYDRFIWNDLNSYELRAAPIAMNAAPGALNETVQVKIRGKSSVADTAAYALSGKVAGVEVTDVTQPGGAPIDPRRNFSETAFFLPSLTTDENGDISFTFTMPESLTKWKWQMLAHTKDLATGLEIRNIITQKDLMIQPNMPRSLREGDKIRLSARVSNLTDKEMSGQAFLQLIDPETSKPVDGWFQNIFPSQYFTVDARQTGAVHFEIQVPANYNKPLQYRVLARAGQQTDGEENLIAVLSNRILVTESLPIIMKGNGSKNYQLKGLTGSAGSNSISHQSLTVEYSTNPAWYAVLALPYLMEYPYECSEQNFNRFYANALASMTANSSPAIQKMFEQWRTTDTAALISNLLKNQELKNIILEQTPWVLQAASESEQRRNIAMLFDMTRLSKELSSNLSKLSEMQLENGAFPWFKGGRDDRYITQYILTGIGRLEKLKAIPANAMDYIEQVSDNALAYTDKKIKEDYDLLIKNKTDLKKNNLGHLQVQYLYLRSFFKEPVPAASKKAYDYYYNQAKQYWVGRNLVNQSMIALVMNRSDKKDVAGAIIKSLKENSITTEDLGMYWKTNSRGYYWYQSPIEAQAQVIEAFSEITTDGAAIENMKLWLLNQKRVQNWSTTKATSDAVYAFLRTGKSMLSNAPDAVIQIGDKQIVSSSEKMEAGTGYFKSVIPGSAVKPTMGDIKVKVQGNSGSGISWGAVHWQYFEDMDKVKTAATPLTLSRAFYIERNSDKGPVLIPIKEGDELKVGDKIKVRIQLKADRDMEYLHLKDLRPSGTEPVNVISSFKWQGGLGYYEATRDASTDFFFSWLPKGTWVFEYPLFVTHSGDFAAGISTIESMYAPEFNAHSEGRRIGVGQEGRE